MSDTLIKICAKKREHIAICRSIVPIHEMEKRAATAPRIRNFAEKLQKKIENGNTGLIAEIKKASPIHRKP